MRWPAGNIASAELDILLEASDNSWTSPHPLNLPEVPPPSHTHTLRACTQPLNAHRQMMSLGAHAPSLRTDKEPPRT
eukprot:2944697-Rhodomonas_salina.2